MKPEELDFLEELVKELETVIKVLSFFVNESVGDTKENLEFLNAFKLVYNYYTGSDYD